MQVGVCARRLTASEWAIEEVGRLLLGFRPSIRLPAVGFAGEPPFFLRPCLETEPGTEDAEMEDGSGKIRMTKEQKSSTGSGRPGRRTTTSIARPTDKMEQPRVGGRVS